MIGLKASRGRLHVSDLWVSPKARGTGAGAKMLREVLKLADDYGVEVQLWAKPYDLPGSPAVKLSKKELVSWYEKFGFVRVGRSKYMRRPPKRYGPGS